MPTIGEKNRESAGRAGRDVSATRQDAAGYSRRDFLRTAGTGLAFAVVAGRTGMRAVAQTATSYMPPQSSTGVGAWVTIDADGGILILNPAAEMGQGSKTALPVLIAEEMDADWADVRVDDAPVDGDVYGSPAWGGSRSMMTVGSRTVNSYFTQLRLVGAQIRRVLLEDAARRLDVPINELTTEPSVVIHTPSGRRLTYGEIAAFAEVPTEMPDVSETLLKSPQDFRLIGRSVPRIDIPAKTDGSARFAIDEHVDGMVYGMVTRSPVHYGTPASYNEAAIRAMPGVTTTARLDHGVGIIAESIEDVMKAREALEINWEPGAPAEQFDSEARLAEYADMAGREELAEAVNRQGDATAALDEAAKRYEADFLSDHVYHAQMEPLNAVASVRDDGVEIWVGTQSPEDVKSEAARIAGVDESAVTIHRRLLGGGFGRRSNSDFVVEAVRLSREVRRPVKLIWTREDDLHYGMFRPMNLQRLWAGVDDDGNVTAWRHCIVGDGGGLLTSGIEIPFYDIPNQAIERCAVDTGVRLHYWRSVGHGFNKFAIEAFLDEIAADQGADPYDFRRRLMQRAPRARTVLDTVAEMADWGSAVPDGRARGIAFAEQSGSLGAGVAEISVDRSSGRIRVHRFWVALDGGIIVQPDSALAQIEGGIAHGLSSILYESVTFKNGRVQQSNFTDYPVLRMSGMPEVDVRFVASEEHPSGLGESSLPLVGGAVANAFAALTGVRLRRIPFTPERVSAALA
ncbi:MAG: molybdopterin cofactor-binding domain-containing protein [Rhodothermales bacterium]